MSDAHSARAHARLAPSAAHRWITCPGSIHMEKDFPNTTSAFAAEGTAAHELAALCLDTGRDPDDFEGYWVDIYSPEGQPPLRKIDGPPADAKENQWWIVDNEMIDAVTVYVEHIRGIVDRLPDAEPEIEQRLDMTHLDPEIFGTGDATIYSESEKTLYVIDYKHGKGQVVEVNENPQLRLYGAGAAKRYHNRPLERVVLTVIQPRAPHAKGPVRSEEIDVLDMFEFEFEVEEAAQNVRQAEMDATHDTMTKAVWENTYLSAGGHCGFCRAQAVCAKARERSLSVAQAEFGEVGEAVTLSDHTKMTSDQLAAVLMEVSILKSWLNAVETHAHAEACAGRMPTGFKLVPKRATRKWADEQQAQKLLCARFGKETVMPTPEPELLSVAKVEKAVGARKFKTFLDELESDRELAALTGCEEPPELVKKISSGTNLAPISDARPTVKTDAATEFGSAE
jgi:hypothetical protein